MYKITKVASLAERTSGRLSYKSQHHYVQSCYKNTRKPTNKVKYCYQMDREQRTRLTSLSKNSMRGSFDVENFLSEKDIDISSKTYRGTILKVISAFLSKETKNRKSDFFFFLKRKSKKTT